LKLDGLDSAIQVLPFSVMDRYDPTADEQIMIVVACPTLRVAEKLIEACEHCNPEGAEIPFD
jgi:hypothetical protein